MTREQFRNTGKFVNANLFLEVYPKFKLHDECTDIVIYAGENFIQVLKSNEFMYDTFKSRKLEEVEDFLFNKVEKDFDKISTN